MQEPLPKPVRRRGLNRPRVVEAAFSLVDRDGLAALNFRALAKEMNVTAMAAYAHFAGKEDLLAAMAEHALGEMGNDLDADAAWDEQIVAAMFGLHEALSRHPGAADLILARSEGERLNDLRDVLVAVTVSAGLEETEAVDALRALVSYVIGFATLTRSDRPVIVRRGSSTSFEYGLEMLLESLRARVQRSARSDRSDRLESDGVHPCR